jgi:hypothetical protein
MDGLGRLIKFYSLAIYQFGVVFETGARSTSRGYWGSRRSRYVTGVYAKELVPWGPVGDGEEVKGRHLERRP